MSGGTDLSVRSGDGRSRGKFGRKLIFAGKLSARKRVPCSLAKEALVADRGPTPCQNAACGTHEMDHPIAVRTDKSVAHGELELHRGRSDDRVHWRMLNNISAAWEVGLRYSVLRGQGVHPNGGRRHPGRSADWDFPARMVLGNRAYRALRSGRVRSGHLVGGPRRTRRST
jgi:hypothetical protein